jgi:hypothetical protein
MTGLGFTEFIPPRLVDDTRYYGPAPWHIHCFNERVVIVPRRMFSTQSCSNPATFASRAVRAFRHRRVAAFSLVEVMIAAGVIAICGLAGVQLW